MKLICSPSTFGLVMADLFSMHVLSMRDVDDSVGEAAVRDRLANVLGSDIAHKLDFDGLDVQLDRTADRPRLEENDDD